MKKIIISALLCGTTFIVFSQNIYNIITDTVYAVDFCVVNDTAYSINLKITRFPNVFVYEKTEIKIISSKNDVILNSIIISKKDTFLSPQQILSKNDYLLLISTFEIQSTFDKGIVVYKIDKQTLEIKESSYFSFKDNVNFVRINSDYGTIKCIDLDNELIGLFSADTLTDRFSEPASKSIYPTLFKINLLNNTIKLNERYDLLPSKPFGPIQINDSLFMFYVNHKEATKIILFNKKLEILNVSNKFMFYDTFMTAPLDNYISYLKVDNNIYLTSTTDTLTRIGGLNFASRMSVTKMDLYGNVLFRKSFKDADLIINDLINYRYIASENTSLAFYNNKFYLIYFYDNSRSPLFKNNKLYLKIFDSNFNILTEKEFTELDHEIRGISIQLFKNKCYILGNILNTVINYKPYLISLELDSLLTIIPKNEIHNSLISINPNPATNKLNIVFEGNMSKNLIVNVYDSKGSLVKCETILDNEINITNLAQGLYLLTIESEGKRYSNKFIKE